MEIVQQNPKEYFKTLKLLHVALIVGQILFALVAIFMFSNGGAVVNPPVFNQIIDYTLLGTTICFIPASFLYYRWKLNKLKAVADFKLKMNGFRNALIARYTLFEIPSLVSIVAVILTGNYIYLVCTGMIIALMVFLRPTKENVIKDLGLDYNEVTILEDPNTIISEFRKSDD